MGAECWHYPDVCLSVCETVRSCDLRSCERVNMWTCECQDGLMESVLHVTSSRIECQTRSSAMAEKLRDAFVSIEKTLAIDEWTWYTPKVITVAAIIWSYGISWYHFLFVDCCYNVFIYARRFCFRYHIFVVGPNLWSRFINFIFIFHIW